MAHRRCDSMFSLPGLSATCELEINFGLLQAAILTLQGPLPEDTVRISKEFADYIEGERDLTIKEYVRIAVKVTMCAIGEGDLRAVLEAHVSPCNVGVCKTTEEIVLDAIGFGSLIALSLPFVLICLLWNQKKRRSRKEAKQPAREPSSNEKYTVMHDLLIVFLFNIYCPLRWI